MEYTIYLDESGNTGNIELKDDLKWNYGNQPIFTLGSFYIDSVCVNDLEGEILQILQSYDSKLGTENELKSKAKYSFKNELLGDLTELLCNRKVGFYFDISNKKYKVVTNMVSYCVYPYYLYASRVREWDTRRNQSRNAANYLYKTFPEEYLKIYIDLCQNQMEEQEKVNQLIEFLKILCQHYEKDTDIYSAVKKVISAVENYADKSLTVKNLFPVEDFNNKGTRESFLPNVDAYNNILSSINAFYMKQSDSVTIYHDAQKQFSKVLEWWTQELKSRYPNIKNINFPESKDNVLIQLIDFYTGTIARLYSKIIKTSLLDRADREQLKILKPLLQYCNVVAPLEHQKRFFDACGMKTMKTPIPF